MLTLRLNDKGLKRFETGHPWLFAGHVDWTSETKLAPAGCPCVITDKRGGILGGGFLNPTTDLCVRVLYTGKKAVALDSDFFERRITTALLKREKAGLLPYARLINSEGDFLSGLTADLYGDILSLSITSAGMDSHRHLWLPILVEKTGARTLMFKNDLHARKHEGLSLENHHEGAALTTALSPVIENGITYFTDIKDGQKTGWYYDQRANRAKAATQAQGKRILDMHCHSGGFAVACAKAGASMVVGVDRSARAIETAQHTAHENEVEGICRFETAEDDVFLKNHPCDPHYEPYDMVILDPPPYIKNAAARAQGLKGYEKLVGLAMPHLARGGVLVFAACSHHADPASLKKICEKQFKKAGRTGHLFDHTGADTDHPVHPRMPEGRYLTCLWYRVD